MGKTVIAVVGLAASVAIALVAPPLGAAVAGAIFGATATATAIAVVTALVTIGLSLAVGLAFTALTAGAPSAKSAVGPPTVFRQSISNSFIVYGTRRVGGLLVFFHAKVGTDGAHYRYFVIAVAGHRSHSLISWMLNDEIVTTDGSGLVLDGKYAGNAWAWFQEGLSSETANATFVSECDGKWTTDHKGSDVTAFYFKFKLTDDVVQAGMPNMTAIISGKRDILNSATWGDDNAIRVLYDWMATPREEGGFGAYSDEIPDTTFMTAQASVCDETVDGGPRYTLNGVIQTGAAPSEIRDAMIVNMAGKYTYSGGKHIALPGYYIPPTVTLSENDLAGAIQVSPFMTGDIAANEVQGTYVSPADRYQGMPFGTQQLASPPADIKQLDIDLAFTIYRSQAERVARIMLNRAQAEKQVVWPGNIVLLEVAALDTVQVDKTDYSLNNYAFTVANWGMSGWDIVLTLHEENAEIYDEPTVSTPGTPPTIDDGEPVLTSDQIQTILRSTYPIGLTMTGIDAGAVAAITISAFTLDYPGELASVSMPSGSAGGLAFSTDYYPYADLDSIGDTTPTYGATTNYADALNSAAHPYRVFLNQKVTTPADGSPDTGGTGAGGGYGGGPQTA